MPLTLANLDARTRALMLEEIDLDNNAAKLYLSNRLSPMGLKDYPALLRDAAQSHDDSWLAAQLRINARLNTTEQKKKPNGGFTIANVPVTAAETMSEGEFNRFYIRALCRRAVEDKIPSLTIYRAKPVEHPRQESVMKIGTTIDPAALLADLRANPGVDTALGLPPGPNSGLSAKLP